MQDLKKHNDKIRLVPPRDFQITLTAIEQTLGSNFYSWNILVLPFRRRFQRFDCSSLFQSRFSAPTEVKNTTQKVEVCKNRSRMYLTVREKVMKYPTWVGQRVDHKWDRRRIRLNFSLKFPVLLLLLITASMSLNYTVTCLWTCGLSQNCILTTILFQLIQPIVVFLENNFSYVIPLIQKQ